MEAIRAFAIQQNTRLYAAVKAHVTELVYSISPRRTIYAVSVLRQCYSGRAATKSQLDGLSNRIESEPHANMVCAQRFKLAASS